MPGTRRQPVGPRGWAGCGVLLAAVLLAGPAPGQGLVWDVAGRCWRPADGERCAPSWNSAARAYQGRSSGPSRSGGPAISRAAAPAGKSRAVVRTDASQPEGAASDHKLVKILRDVQDMAKGGSGDLEAAEVEALVESLRESGAPVDLLSGVEGGDP